MKVFNQEELDKALSEGAGGVEINFNTRIETSKNLKVAVTGVASVVVISHENSHIEAVSWENSHIKAVSRDNSHIKAVSWENSYINAESWENSYIKAESWDNSHIEAESRENSHIKAVSRGDGHIEGDARDYSSYFYNQHPPTCGKYARAISFDKMWTGDILHWCDVKGIEVVDGRIALWKFVNKDGFDFKTGKINYITDEEIVCPDWDNDLERECGGGLHLSDSEEGARRFVFDENKDGARLIRVSADVNDCISPKGHWNYPMKIRVKKCRFVEEIK